MRSPLKTERGEKESERSKNVSKKKKLTPSLHSARRRRLPLLSLSIPTSRSCSSLLFPLSFPPRYVGLRL